MFVISTVGRTCISLRLINFYEHWNSCTLRKNQWRRPFIENTYVICLHLSWFCGLMQLSVWKAYLYRKNHKNKNSVGNLTLSLSSRYSQSFPWDFEITLFLAIDENQHCWSSIEEEQTCKIETSCSSKFRTFRFFR